MVGTGGLSLPNWATKVAPTPHSCYSLHNIRVIRYHSCNLLNNIRVICCHSRYFFYLCYPENRIDK